MIITIIISLFHIEIDEANINFQLCLFPHITSFIDVPLIFPFSITFITDILKQEKHFFFLGFHGFLLCFTKQIKFCLRLYFTIERIDDTKLTKLYKEHTYM